MNSREESDVKKAEAKTLSLEKDRQAAKRIIQYMYFYFAVITCLSLSAYLLDLIFYKIDYSNLESMIYGPFQYFPFYMLMGIGIFPLSLAYNYIINISQPVHIGFRILICVAFIAFGCYFINPNYKFGYYIGKYRQIKNIIDVCISGVLVELIRDWAVKRRNRKRTEEEEWGKKH